jgi:hypothetical protein
VSAQRLTGEAPERLLRVDRRRLGQGWTRQGWTRQLARTLPGPAFCGTATGCEP